MVFFICQGCFSGFFFRILLGFSRTMAVSLHSLALLYEAQKISVWVIPALRQAQGELWRESSFTTTFVLDILTMHSPLWIPAFAGMTSISLSPRSLPTKLFLCLVW
jgi:hypothetical protein